MGGAHEAMRVGQEKMIQALREDERFADILVKTDDVNQLVRSARHALILETDMATFTSTKGRNQELQAEKDIINKLRSEFARQKHKQYLIVAVSGHDIGALHRLFPEVDARTGPEYIAETAYVKDIIDRMESDYGLNPVKYDPRPTGFTSTAKSAFRRVFRR